MIPLRLNYPEGFRYRYLEICDTISYRHDGRSRQSDYDTEVYRVRQLLRRYGAFYKSRRATRKRFTRERLAVLSERNGFQYEGLHSKPHDAAYPPFKAGWKFDEGFPNLRYDVTYLNDCLSIQTLPNAIQLRAMLDQADSFRSKRVPWRRITEAHAYCILRDMGSRLV